MPKAGKPVRRTAKKKKNAPVRRGSEALIVLFLVLAILITIGFFARDAVLLSRLCGGIAYVLGPGLFAVPVVLLVTAVYLILSINSKKKALWLVSLWMLPVFVGMVWHIFSAHDGYLSVHQIGEDGMGYVSGGLISGGLADLLIRGLSRVGAGVVIFFLLILNLLAFFRLPLRSVIELTAAALERGRESAAARRALAREERAYMKSLALEEEEEEEEYEEAGDGAYSLPAFVPEKERRQRIDIPLETRKKSIDIPLDGYNPPPEGAFAPSGDRPAGGVFVQAPGKASMTPKEVEKEIAGLGRAKPRTQNRDYAPPPMGLLTKPRAANGESIEAEVKANSGRLISTLSSFNIEAWIVNITRGPSVTRYEIQLGSGIKTSRISALSDDIALALGAQTVRISNIPDRSAVGIEVPNKNSNIVYLREVLESGEFSESASPTTFALGKDIAGKPVVGDIAKLPHMLVGGTTNSGKSVCINTILISLLYKASPDEVKLILIDPKMVEFRDYGGIPHLLIPVVTDPKKAAGALAWAVMEMMTRYKRFTEVGARNITDYNLRVEKMQAKSAQAGEPAPGLDEVPFDLDDGDIPKGLSMDGAEPGGEAPVLEKMPRIVIVIDELADLMLASRAEVEDHVCRIAQMARAAGMHLIVATQRPSADIITGLMKANIPSRIAFSVASSLESRIILDQNGAEKLLGRGDMLFSPIGVTKPVRIQGCYVSSEEIIAVVGHVKKGGAASYDDDVISQIEKNVQNGGKPGGGQDGGGEDGFDALFDDAVSGVLSRNQASTTMIQRMLGIGFARAARIMDQMEESGIVGPSEGAKPRQILITKDEWAERQYRRENM